MKKGIFIKKKPKLFKFKNIANSFNIRKKKSFRLHSKNFNIFKISPTIKLSSSIYKNYPNILNIKISSNNMFCTLNEAFTNKTLIKCCAGKYKIKLSKKSLKFHINKILYLFFRENKFRKAQVSKKNLIVVLTAPARIKTKILKQFISISKKNLIIKINSKKCFNGCKVSKKKRKKQRGFRVFK
jgi:hypothetical protein